MSDEDPSARRLLTRAAIRALKNDGWTVSPAPGLARNACRRISREGADGIVAIRTTKDRWFAFNPSNRGREWRTLDKARYVCVAAYNDKQDPTRADVYTMDASDVQASFKDAYKARRDAGHRPDDDFPMWVGLDAYTNEHHAFVGAGLGTMDTLIARFPIVDGALQEEVREVEEAAEAVAATPSSTVADVLTSARLALAVLLQMPADKVDVEFHVRA